MSEGEPPRPGPPDPLSSLLGFELLDVRPGFARVRGVVRPEHTNQHGTAHGGVVFALADTAFAAASNSHGPVAVALVASIHFVRAVRSGEELVAEAKELSLTSRAATYAVTVTREDAVVAAFTGTVHRRDRPSASDTA